MLKELTLSRTGSNLLTFVSHGDDTRVQTNNQMSPVPSPRAQKRIKLDSPSPPSSSRVPASTSSTEDNCSICLQPILDRTLLPACSHEFCFECILVWSGQFSSAFFLRYHPTLTLKDTSFRPKKGQSRRCPLCTQPLGGHLIHHIRSKYDYQKHYLPALRTSPPPGRLTQVTRRPPRPRVEREWGRHRQEREEADRLDRAIAKRRWIYQHHLYAKVSSLFAIPREVLIVCLLCLLARCIQFVHSLSAVPYSSAIRWLSRVYQSHDDVPTQGTARMD